MDIETEDPAHQEVKGIPVMTKKTDPEMLLCLQHEVKITRLELEGLQRYSSKEKLKE